MPVIYKIDKKNVAPAIDADVDQYLSDLKKRLGGLSAYYQTLKRININVDGTDIDGQPALDVRIDVKLAKGKTAKYVDQDTLPNLATKIQTVYREFIRQSVWLLD